MTPAELREHKDKPVHFRDCVLILRAARQVSDGKGGTRIKCLLQDRHVKSSYVVARIEELKTE